MDAQSDAPTLYCPHCDYNLSGLSSNRCPECGNPFDRVALAEARRVYSAPAALRKTHNLTFLLALLLLAVAYSGLLTSGLGIHRKPAFWLPIAVLPLPLSLAVSSGVVLAGRRKPWEARAPRPYRIAFALAATGHALLIVVLTTRIETRPAPFYLSTLTFLGLTFVPLGLRWAKPRRKLHVRTPALLDAFLAPVAAILAHSVLKHSTRHLRALLLNADGVVFCIVTAFISFPFLLVCRKLDIPTLPVFVALVLVFSALIPSVS